jgi:uridylate kinase
MAKPYRRVLLKLSGEALMGNLGYGIDPITVQEIAAEVAEIVASNVQVAIVVGGAISFAALKRRQLDGSSNRRLYRHDCYSDECPNAQDALEGAGVQTRVQTAIAMQVAEPYIRRRAIRHLEKGE